MMTAALVVLVGLISGVSTYWYFLFKRLLPLEISLRRFRGHADDLKMFSLEVLGEGLSGDFSHALNGMGHRTLGALHKLSPEISLWWIARREDGAAVVVARRGAARGQAAPDGFKFDSRIFWDAVEEGGRSYDLSAGTKEDPFLRSLADGGLKWVRLIPWGKANGAAGILAVGDADPQGGGLSRLRPFIDMVKPLATSMAVMAQNLDSLTKTRESLQGGLSIALDNLNDTHSRLIQKSKQIKTLHEVASTLSVPSIQTKPTLNAIVSIVAKSLEADMVAFLLLDQATGELVTQPGAYGLESEDLFYRIPVTQSESSSVRVFKSGEPFMTGKAQNDPRVIARYAKLWRIHSLMVIPLKVENHSIGVLRIGSYKPDYFTQEHLDLMTVIAREAAIIVDMAMLNQKLSETAEQLTALNRIKDDFVSTVSHEFKTPLTTIMGFIRVLLEGDAGVLNEQQGKFLNIAMGATNRLAGLVSDLLDISRLESGLQMEMKRHDFDKLLRSSIENHLHQAVDAGKTMTCDIPAHLPGVICDERWVGLALDNLISNAVKFTPPGGKVHVSATDKGEFLMVCVADSGIGIPPTDKDSIFEKFFRAANRAETNAPGTGLGLAIAKEVVSRHGGKIWFESELGRGSKFYFILKVAPRSKVED